jgi:ribosomal protein L24E
MHGLRCEAVTQIGHGIVAVRSDIKTQANAAKDSNADEEREPRHHSWQRYERRLPRWAGGFCHGCSGPCQPVRLWLPSGCQNGI